MFSKIATTLGIVDYNGHRRLQWESSTFDFNGCRRCLDHTRHVEKPRKDGGVLIGRPPQASKIWDTRRRRFPPAIIGSMTSVKPSINASLLSRLMAAFLAACV